MGRSRLFAFVLFVSCSACVAGQSTATDAAVVPTLVNFSGTLTGLNGKPLTGLVGVTFCLYKDSSGGAPLWIETQNVQADKGGHYTVALGTTKSQGLPTDLFASGEARWLGVQPEGLEEQPRVMLLAVPYALKAVDAQTLSGRPASSFVTVDAQGTGSSEEASRKVSASTSTAAPGAPTVHGGGTPNFLPIWTASTTLGDSAIAQSGTNVGIGTTTPGTPLDVVGSVRSSAQLVSTLATGTAPLAVNSTTQVANLNASLLSGIPASSFATTGSNNFVGTENIAGVLAIGTPPLGNAVDIVSSGTQTNGLQVQSNTLNGAGVFGRADNGIDAVGVFGGSRFATGVFGTSGGSGDGVIGTSFSGSGIVGEGGLYAANFIGDILVSGAVFASTKDFLIDHPLDPANRYLYHASVESSEMKDIYDGMASLDAYGEAVVDLPEWFQALNGNFRYQLTAVGAPGPNLYIAEEIANHRFKIAGGTAGMKVSWQVTGVRQDAFAKAHPLRIEVDKLEGERGYYVHPELYGESEEKDLAWLHHPALRRQIRVQREQAARDTVSAQPAK